MLSPGVNLPNKSLFLTATSAVIFSIINLILNIYSRFEDTSFDCLEWLDCMGNFYTTDVGLISNLRYYISVIGWQEIINQISHFMLIVAVMILVTKSWSLREKNKILYQLSIFILLTIFLHTFMSMWFSDMFLLPQIALLHFELGVIISLLLWIYAVRTQKNNWSVSKKNIHRFNKTKPWITLAIIISMIEIALGGWTSVKFASFACTDFPLCQNTWWPEMDLKEGFNFNRPLGLEALDSQPRIAIHMVHRFGVLVAMIYVLVLSIFLLKMPSYKINQVARVLMYILFIRMIFLAYAGYLQDTVFLTIVHNLGSLTLLLVLVGLAIKMTYVSSNNFN